MALSSKILWAMILVIALSFVATLGVAFLTSKNQDEVYNAQRLERKERAIERSLEYVIDGIEIGKDDSEKLAALMNDRICELSEIHDLTISLYNLDGLKITSSSAVGTRYRVPPQVLEEILDTEKRDDDSDEGWDLDLGEVVEAYLRFDDLIGRPLAVVGLKYEKRQVDGADFFTFIKGLAPVYMVLFLMASGLAIVLAQTITRPIRQLTIGLGQLGPDQPKPQPLQYEATDDIGKLVAAYNSVQEELQEKIRELSRRERESAWRLMAMQVAHEIKNPLTPLRLGLQQLIRAWRDNRTDFDQRLMRYEETATAQMEVLNAIATDFSMLAELNPNLGAADVVDWAEVAREAVDLWSAGHPQWRWMLDIEEGTWHVKGKKTHLTRVLNNLMSNAIHALEEGSDADAVVKLAIHRAPEDQVELVISDSGPGIPVSERAKIFEPRFTTKSHGTGMGLAMVWAIVKQYGGDIAVGTSEFGGASFSIRFPLIRP